MKFLNIVFFTFISILPYGSATAQIKIEDVVKVGTKLMYRIDTKSKSYDCIITIKNLSPFIYNYTIVDSANATGSVTHTKGGLRKGYNQRLEFNGQDIKLDDQTTSLWISSKAFNKFVSHARRPIPIKINEHESWKMGTAKGTGSFNVKLNGTDTSIAEEVIKVKIKFSRQFVETGEELIGFYPSKNLPIVLRLKTDFYMELLNIVTQ